MANVKVLIVESGGIEIDSREANPANDVLLIKGIENQFGDLTLNSASNSETLDGIRTELNTLDGHKDNGVGGFDNTTMNNLTLWNAINGLGGPDVGPPTYPISMSATGNANNTFLEWGDGLSSNVIPFLIPFDTKALAISLIVDPTKPAQFDLEIFRNTAPPYSFVTPVITLSTTGTDVTSLYNSSLGNLFNAGDLFSFKTVQKGGSSNFIQDPAAVLWLQNRD